MDWQKMAEIALAAIGGGLITAAPSLIRARGQNVKDAADAVESLSTSLANLSARFYLSENEHAKEIDALRDQLQADIEAKDIRLRRLESDVVKLKNSLAEWRSYALGLFDMLVRLGQQPPKPPDTGPLNS